jgi:hypothetical protein
MSFYQRKKSSRSNSEIILAIVNWEKKRRHNGHKHQGVNSCYPTSIFLEIYGTYFINLRFDSKKIIEQPSPWGGLTCGQTIKSFQ